MTKETTNSGNVPATKTSVKEKIDKYVNQTLEHLQELSAQGNLDLPSDYSMENALKGASLKLQMVTDKDGKLALEVCSAVSIVNSLLAMVIDGLSVWKQQGYFIVYGDKLNWQPDYRGHILLAKRHADVKEVNAQVVYEGDEFFYQIDTKTGRQQLINHESKFENQDITKIRGAYAVVVFNDGSSSVTIMSMPQIKKAWLQGFGGGNTKAHQNFTDEMCKKTVINRATKTLIGSSDDADVIDEDKQVSLRNAKAEKGSAKKEIDIHDTSYEEVKGEVAGPLDGAVKEATKAPEY